MFNAQMELVSTAIRSTTERLAAGEDAEAAWSAALEAVRTVRAQEAELAALVEARDVDGLKGVIAAWDAGKRHLPVQDREVLSRAMKAFRKSLKVTRLDAESSLSGGVFSSGRESSILGIRPPDRYPRAVWDELARQKRLVSAGHGVYELPPGG